LSLVANRRRIEIARSIACVPVFFGIGPVGATA